MLKGILQRLTGTAGGGVKRDVIILLNHNPADPREPGDVDLFGRVEALVGDVAANDIRSGAYLAVDTKGHLITMTEESAAPDAGITASVARHASEAQLAMRMLKHYLQRQLEVRDLDYTAEAVDREINMAKLIGMVPPKDVFG